MSKQKKVVTIQTSNYEDYKDYMAAPAAFSSLSLEDLPKEGYEDPEYTFTIVPNIDYKFNEAELIKEFKTYVDSTYSQHYAKEKFQATEYIVDGGHGTGFCIGNVLKYAQRYGKKGTSADARKDLMKVLHYALIQLYVHDKEI